jgi:hypothetical protein
MFYWAEQQPVPQDKILSPSWKNAAAPVVLAGEPALAAPNQEVPADHTMRAGPALDRSGLTVPPGSAGMPLTDSIPASDAPQPPGWTKLGDAVNALVLSAEQRPDGDRLVLLPPGSNSGRPASSMGSNGAGTLRHSALEREAANQSEPASRARMIAEILNPDEYAVVEYPAGSSFDVITTHSSSADAFPHAKVSLSGAPVYTAYIPVGDGTEWLFQYCLTGSARRDAADSRFISLEHTDRIQAPFPTVAVLPKGAATPSSTYGVVHATLTLDGRLNDISISGYVEKSYVARLLQALSAWQFRPVFLNDQPAEAEILMGISR